MGWSSSPGSNASSASTLEVVDRQTEASLAVTGCADLIEADPAGALMFDIGGGSSELAWLDFRGGRPRRQGGCRRRSARGSRCRSGVVSIAEKFGGVDVTAETFEDMIQFVVGSTCASSAGARSCAR